MNPRGSVTSSVNSNDDFNNKNNINEEKEGDKAYAFPDTNNFNPTSKMSNPKSNNLSCSTSGCTKEEDITPDDLQAMKDLRHVFDPQETCNPHKMFPSARRCADFVARKQASV